MWFQKVRAVLSGSGITERKGPEVGKWKVGDDRLGVCSETGVAQYRELKVEGDLQVFCKRLWMLV